MIFAALADSAPYRALSPRFAAGLDFCLGNDVRSLPLGRVNVLGDDVYALVQENRTKPPELCRWEAHRTYADIQLVVTAAEAMGVVPLACCAADGAFDDGKDVGFYHCSGGAAQRLIVPAGHFAIFFPHDVHMPLIAAGDPELVRKVVVKVRL